ncbi:MAG: hypothetical protein ABWK01_09205 [Infirmifilum sp.]
MRQILEQNSLLNSVKLVNTEKYPLHALENGVLSVPAFAIENNVVLQGYFTDEDVVHLIQTGAIKIQGFEEAFERLIKSIFSSFLVASTIYLKGSFDVLQFSEKYLLSASGAFFLPERKTFLDMVNIKFRDLKVDSSNERNFLRIIGGNFVRDLYWLRRKLPSHDELQALGIRFFREWLFQRASLGRVFVPQSVTQTQDLEARVEKAWNYILERFDRIASHVLEEQQAIPENWL